MSQKDENEGYKFCFIEKICHDDDRKQSTHEFFFISFREKKFIQIGPPEAFGMRLVGVV